MLRLKSFVLWLRLQQRRSTSWCICSVQVLQVHWDLSSSETKKPCLALLAYLKGNKTSSNMQIRAMSLWASHAPSFVLIALKQQQKLITSKKHDILYLGICYLAEKYTLVDCSSTKSYVSLVFISNIMFSCIRDLYWLLTVLRSHGFYFTNQLEVLQTCVIPQSLYFRKF